MGKRRGKRGNKAKSNFSSSDYEILETDLGRMTASVPYEKPDEILSQYDELRVLKLTRDMRKNNSQVKSWFHQYFLNVINSGQKPVFNTENKDWNKEAARYYRKRSRDWNGRTGSNRYSTHETLFKSVLGDGGVLAYYDQAGHINKSKFIYFTKEYMPTISENDFKKNHRKIARILGVKPSTELIQNKGIIENKYGVTLGYVVSGTPSGSDEAFKDVTVLGVKFNKIKMIIHDADMNQKHGNSALLSTGQDINDISLLRKSQVKKADIQSRVGLVMKVKDSAVKQGFRSNQDPQDVKTRKKAERVSGANAMENMEQFGEKGDVFIEYIDKDESVEALSLAKGEASEIKELYQFISILGGFSLGLTRLYSTGDASHATFASLMAETNLAQLAFAYSQKWWEREVLDWELECVMQDTSSHGSFKLDADWDLVTWTDWPKTKSLNPLQDIKAIKEAAAMGKLSPEEILGANWEERLEKLGELQGKILEAGLNLEIFPETQTDSEEVNNSNKEEENE